MVKIIMKRIPHKVTPNVQHNVMRNWSATIVENYSPNQSVKIISRKELNQYRENLVTDKK